MCKNLKEVRQSITNREGINMTEEQIVRYTELCKRRSELAICGGVNWKPEYGPELEQVERELAELKKIKEAAIAERDAARKRKKEQEEAGV